MIACCGVAVNAARLRLQSHPMVMSRARCVNGTIPRPRRQTRRLACRSGFFVPVRPLAAVPPVVLAGAGERLRGRASLGSSNVA
jgi:hypothetical protein